MWFTTKLLHSVMGAAGLTATFSSSRYPTGVADAAEQQKTLGEKKLYVV